MSKLETQLAPLAVAILKSAQNSMREKVGTSKLQLRAPFKCKASYGTDRKQSRNIGGWGGDKGWSQQTQGVRNQCTHWGGNLGRPPAWLRVSERRGLGNRPNGVFCASSRHIPISHGYLYSSPNWKVGLWTICMHVHMHSLALSVFL